jgi:decaprenylphospho-beta-D-ribofuranose 2-oxidase
VQAKDMRLTSWGRNLHADMTAYRPERFANLCEAVRIAEPGGTIAYGDGRNYGDLSLCEGGTSIMTARLDRFLAFDEDGGTIAVEPGVTFTDLQAFALPRGFLPPVTPGTGFVTVGGGVASDVHGKNHDRDGSLENHIGWLDIVLADGSCVRTSRDERPDLFAATVGGCGLTGIIAAIGLRLRRHRANAVETHEFRVRDLEHYFQLMTEHRNTSTYTVGWIDALQRGAHLGRGIFQTGEPVDVPSVKSRERTHSVPFTFPNMTLNRVSVALFNEMYYRRMPTGGRSRIVDYDTFHHPLDAVENWNRFYGRGGFYQFQCVLPDEMALPGVKVLLEKVATARAASFLGVLKTFGAEGLGHLSFPRPGVTLSLDIPARAETLALMQSLEATTLEHGGRLYLAKDAVMSADGFAQMYPRLDEFRAVLEKYDPDGKFGSEMSRRLKMRAAT